MLSVKPSEFFYTDIQLGQGSGILLQSRHVMLSVMPGKGAAQGAFYFEHFGQCQRHTPKSSVFSGFLKIAPQKLCRPAIMQIKGEAADIRVIEPFQRILP